MPTSDDMMDLLAKFHSLEFEYCAVTASRGKWNRQDEWQIRLSATYNWTGKRLKRVLEILDEYSIESQWFAEKQVNDSNTLMICVIRVVAEVALQ